MATIATTGRRRRGRGRRPGLLLACGAAVAVAAGIGGIAARTAEPGYYDRVGRPSWSPPAEVFSPVWIALYVLMAIAAWLVAREGPARPEVRLALILFGVQLALNAAWTPLFFGLQSPGWALADIAALLVALAATVAAFARVRPAAAALMAPYLAWVAFATALNAAIVAG